MAPVTTAGDKLDVEYTSISLPPEKGHKWLLLCPKGIILCDLTCSGNLFSMFEVRACSVSCLIMGETGGKELPSCTFPSAIAY